MIEILIGAVVIVLMTLFILGVLYIVDTLGIEYIIIIALFLLMSYVVGCAILSVK